MAKKRIRAIQYGVGPIGAGLARLMREKQSIEIIGAIDTDPEKAGRDLGEVVGAADAPWGVSITSHAEVLLQESADVVVHSTSSSLPAVADQLIACLAAESCVVSTCEELSYPVSQASAVGREARRGSEDLGRGAGGHGRQPGIRDG